MSTQYQKAAKELLRRRLASESLLEYIKYTKPDYVPAQHHIKICEALDNVIKGRIDRLIINVGPRHGKSEIASRRLPPYYLSLFPDREVIFSTSSAELAGSFGAEVLEIIQDPLHKNVFPEFKLKTSKPKRDLWRTNRGGVYFASGVGGTITGRGGNLIIVDDAIKNMKEAESPSVRRDMWNWYTSVLSTRKTNTRLPAGQRAAIIVIQTKWHEDDLSGRLVQEMRAGGEGWNVIDLPALTTLDGRLPTRKEFEDPKKLKALWPEQYDVEALLNERGKDPIKQRHFSCLYQQVPVPDDGIYFDAGWFNQVDLQDVPENLVYYVCSDYALLEGRGDQTWHIVVGVDSSDRYWVVDGYYGNTNMLDWIDKLLDCAILYKPVCLIGEAGQIGRASEPYIRKRMRERTAYFKLEHIVRTNKKDVEARSLQAVAAQGKVNIVKGPFGDTILEQLVKFPAGQHDDAVDALANLFLFIEKLYGRNKGNVVSIRKRDRWSSPAIGQGLNWKII